MRRPSLLASVAIPLVLLLGAVPSAFAQATGGTGESKEKPGIPDKPTGGPTFTPPDPGSAAAGGGRISPVDALVARLGEWPREDAKEAARLLAAAWETSRDAVRAALAKRPLDGRVAAGAAWVVAEAGDVECVPDLTAALAEKTVQAFSTQIWQSLAKLDASKSREPLVDRLKNWPSEDAKKAARLLVSTWDQSREPVRAALRRRPPDARMASGAAWVVAEAGELSMADDLAALLKERALFGRPGEVIDALVRVDPAHARDRLLALLDIPSNNVVVAAADALQSRVTKDDLPALLALTASRSPTTRRTGLGLAAELDFDAARPALEEALGDPSGEVASAVALNLGYRADGAGLASLNARVRGPESRRAAWSLMALVRAGERSGAIALEDATVAALLGSGGIRSSDRSLRLASAIALADLAHSRQVESVDAMLEREIVPVLLEAVAGVGFFSDLAVLRPVAVERLHLLCEGTSTLETGPQWAGWWERNGDGFRARRALVSLDGAQRARARVTVSGSATGAAGAGVFTSDSTAVPAEGGAGGRFLLLEPAEMDGILAALEKAGFFGLPEASPAEGDPVPALQIEVGADHRFRRARWLRADSMGEPFAAVLEVLEEVREANRWQALWDRRSAPSFPAFVDEQRRFWREAPEEERNARRVHLAAAACRDLPVDEDRRDLLDRMASFPGLDRHLDSTDASILASFVAVGDRITPSGEAAVRVLAAAGSPAALPPLRLRLRSGVQSTLVEGLLRDTFARIALPAVASAARDGDAPEIRRAALAALALRGSPELGAIARAALGSNDGTVRGAALRALGTARDPEALALLTGALREEQDPDTLEGAVDGLGALGGPDVVAPLAKVLRSPDPRMRAAAVGALAATGEADAISLVLALMPSESEAAVRAAADEALRTVGGERVRQSLLSVALDRRHDAEARVRAVDGLGILGAEGSTGDLRSLLLDPEPEVADRAAFVLGWIRDAAAAPRLVEALAAGRSPAMATRCLEVLSLESFRDTRDREEKARYYTGWLQVQGERGARGWLAEALMVRGIADAGVAAWDESGDARPAVPAFLRAFRETDWYVRRALDLELRRLSGTSFGEIDEWTSPDGVERVLAGWTDWWAREQRGR